MRIGPVFFVVGAAVCAAGATGSLLLRAAAPYKGFPTETQLVTIESGMPAHAAAVRLERAGVIRSSLVFRVLTRIRGVGARIHAGEYRFSGELTPGQVLDKLVTGEVVRHRLTVPEGLRLDEIAGLLQAEGFGQQERFLEAAKRVELIADLDPDAKDLEGYLFPETYFFARGTAEEQIVAEMVLGFRTELTPQRLARIRELGLTPRQTVILASLIEEEARMDDERGRISAVFHNRLEKGMPLQCDPTVVYALVRNGRYRGEIHRSDLAHESPYNTYLSPGLPPGPISSPGGKSLEAALFPARTKELYFVVSGPGRHEFSRTREEHDRAVLRYRRERKALNRAR